MKTIPLTRGFYAKVDDEDYGVLSQYKWCVGIDKGRAYAKRGIKNSSVTRTIHMHREILGLTDSRELCDHIDGDALNNQRSNLRVCTVGQNNRNRKISPGGSSIYKGVIKSDRRYYARIRKDGKAYNLGGFDSEHDAALAYNEAAIKYHGEFARLNELQPES